MLAMLCVSSWTTAPLRPRLMGLSSRAQGMPSASRTQARTLPPVRCCAARLLTLPCARGLPLKGSNTDTCNMHHVKCQI